MSSCLPPPFRNRWSIEGQLNPYKCRYSLQDKARNLDLALEAVRSHRARGRSIFLHSSGSSRGRRNGTAIRSGSDVAQNRYRITGSARVRLSKFRRPQRSYLDHPPRGFARTRASSARRRVLQCRVLRSGPTSTARGTKLLKMNTRQVVELCRTRLPSVTEPSGYLLEVLSGEARTLHPLPGPAARQPLPLVLAVGLRRRTAVAAEVSSGLSTEILACGRTRCRLGSQTPGAYSPRRADDPSAAGDPGGEPLRIWSLERNRAQPLDLDSRPAHRHRPGESSRPSSWARHSHIRTSSPPICAGRRRWRNAWLTGLPGSCVATAP